MPTDRSAAVPHVHRGAGITLLLALLLIIGVHAPLAQASSKTPTLTFVIDSSWSASERAQLSSDLDPSGKVMKTVAKVVGSPSESQTVTVSKTTGGNVGEYDATNHQMNLNSPQLSVLVHELNHATHGSHFLSNAVWEEGLARAAESEEMRLLAAQGITEPGYDINHSHDYDEYYDQDNVPAVGVPNGNIYAGIGLVALRYEQAGYAFTKALIENSSFIAKFNAKLFKQPSGVLSRAQLISMAKSVQSKVEGMSFATWASAQHIFDVDQSTGCYIFQRVNQFSVDLYCVGDDGTVITQGGADVSLAIKGPQGASLFSGTANTSSYGVAMFHPSLDPAAGRVQLTATSNTFRGPVTSTVYRQAADDQAGVFGVVTGAATGTISFSSPKKQFKTFSVPVANGAFEAPSLTSVRGQIVAKYSGPGVSAVRTFDKDAAPYSLVLAGQQDQRLTTPSAAAISINLPIL